MATTTPRVTADRSGGDPPSRRPPSRDPRLRVALAAIAVLVVVIILLLAQNLRGDNTTPAVPPPGGGQQTEQPADPYATEPGVVATKRLLEDMVTSGSVATWVTDGSGLCYTPLGDPPPVVSGHNCMSTSDLEHEEVDAYLAKCYTLDGTIQPETLVVDESVNPDLWFKEEDNGVVAYGFGFTIETTDGETVIGKIVADLMTDTGNIRLDSIRYGDDAKPVGS